MSVDPVVSPAQYVQLLTLVCQSHSHVIAECKRKNIPRKYWKHLLAKDEK